MSHGSPRVPKSRKLARAKSLSSREGAVEAREQQLRADDQSSADVREELEALMAALREANGHLIIANLRSETLAEQMHQLYEEAQSAIQAKDDFFAVISHELRTPLTSIIGWAGLLERNPDPATIAEAARSIASSARVQAKLIDDLLDVSRIMTGKFAITAETIDLRTVVDETLRGIRPLADARGIALRMDLDSSVVVEGDAARLSQVVSNLLSNAIKFTPPGGLIETALSRDGACAIIRVCDTGEGISPEFLPLVFERRSQATNRRFAGLGLGLAIVKHIVELHGGSVEAASEGEGKGATFTVRLPCAS